MIAGCLILGYLPPPLLPNVLILDLLAGLVLIGAGLRWLWLLTAAFYRRACRPPYEPAERFAVRKWTLVPISIAAVCVVAATNLVPAVPFFLCQTEFDRFADLERANPGSVRDYQRVGIYFVTDVCVTGSGVSFRIDSGHGFQETGFLRSGSPPLTSQEFETVHLFGRWYVWSLSF